MNLNLAPEVQAALIGAFKSTSGAEAICQALEPMVVRVVTGILEKQREKPEPLAAIFDCKAATARKREQRDAGLRALAIVGSSRRLYLRSQVLSYLQTRGRK